MLDKLANTDKQISRATFNGMVENATAAGNIGVVCGDLNIVGNANIIPQEQPEPGCWAKVTGIAKRGDGVTPIIDINCHLSYHWYEQERFSDDGSNVHWRDKQQFPRHSIHASDDYGNPGVAPQHLLREVNGKTLRIGQIVWVYPGISLFNGPQPAVTNSSNWEHLCLAPSEKPIRVRVDQDWYACQIVSGTQMTVQVCAVQGDCPGSSCPVCDSCSQGSCPDCPPDPIGCLPCPEDPCLGVPLPLCDDCPTCAECLCGASSGHTSSGHTSSGHTSSGHTSSGTESSGTSSSGSSGCPSVPTTISIGLTPCCVQTTDPTNCSCPQPQECPDGTPDTHCSAFPNGNAGCELQAIDYCAGTVMLADPLGTIDEPNMWSVKDANCNYYIPAGTFVYVWHLDDAWDLEGNALYEPTGAWGAGCECDDCDSCPPNSCADCPSCGASSGCSCNHSSCQTCSSCNSCDCLVCDSCLSCGSSGGSSGHSSSTGSGSTGKSAIITANWSPTGFTAVYCMEMPEVKFEDVMTVKIEAEETFVTVDPKYLDSILTDTLSTMATADEPWAVGSKMVGTSVRLRLAKASPTVATVRFSGIRKGFCGVRFPEKTLAEYEANEKRIAAFGA